MSCTGGNAALWLCLWEAWVGIHLLAAYCSGSLRQLLAPDASRQHAHEVLGQLAQCHPPAVPTSWTAAVPWKLLLFHSCRAALLPVAMGVGPYWVASLSRSWPPNF